MRSEAKGVLGGRYIVMRYFSRARSRHKAGTSDPIGDENYRALALFRRQLRGVLSFSKGATAEAGLTAQQHQALLAIRAAADRSLPVGELADQLQLPPRSATGWSIGWRGRGWWSARQGIAIDAAFVSRSPRTGWTRSRPCPPLIATSCVACALG